MVDIDKIKSEREISNEQILLVTFFGELANLGLLNQGSAMLIGESTGS